MQWLTLLSICYLWLVWVVDGARILAVLPIPGKSHHRMFQPILKHCIWSGSTQTVFYGFIKTLARAGHHVTSYSPFTLDRPVLNYTEIQIENMFKLEDEKSSQITLEVKSWPYRDCYNVCYVISEMIYDLLLRSPELQQLFKSMKNFDLVIIEHTCGSEYLTILGHIFNAPVLGVHAFMTNDVLNSLSGNALSMSFLPDTCTPYSNRMGFTERFVNTFNVLRRLYIHYYRYLPGLEAKMRRSFPEMPPLLDMTRNVSLTFVNDHLTTEYAFPRSPSIIPVGGVHIEPPGRLPKDIQKFMDGAEEGVILFSLGTYIPDHLQPKAYFDLYLSAFSRLRQRVLWKTRKTDFDSLPPNVLTKPWMPQQGILNHPKCVLFVTHGGQHSQLESVHYGVPVVTIPQFFDQFRNARLFVEKGVGLTLNEEHVTQQSLLNAIQTVLGDKRYGQNMARLSALSRDRPQSAAQSVVYWAEYVIRHEGAPHLRPVAATMPWYQRALLDVAAALVLIIVAMFTFIYYILRLLRNCLRNINYIKLRKKVD